MNKNTRQRQAKQAAKKLRRNRRVLAKGGAENFGSKLQRAKQWPVAKAMVGDAIFEQGIGSVVLTRESPSGMTALVTVLVDAWCLGVKDGFVKIVGRETASAIASEMSRKAGPFKNVTPEYAKKLIVRSVEYGVSLGLKPASEFEHCFGLFQGIDESLCPDEFEFGQNGKPLYCAGPNDSPAFVRRVMDTLENSRGQGNFDYILPAESVGLQDEIEQAFESGEGIQNLEWMVDEPEDDQD